MCKDWQCVLFWHEQSSLIKKKSSRAIGRGAEKWSLTKAYHCVSLCMSTVYCFHLDRGQLSAYSKQEQSKVLALFLAPANSCALTWHRGSEVHSHSMSEASALFITVEFKCPLMAQVKCSHIAWPKWVNALDLYFYILYILYIYITSVCVRACMCVSP